jgi:hypothetical protein
VDDIREHTEKVCDASQHDRWTPTVIYRVTDLAAPKRGARPPFSRRRIRPAVLRRLSIGGYELSLDPDPSGGKTGPGGSVAYWRVASIDSAVRYVASGAAVVAAAQGRSARIKVATVGDPFGNLIGLIENPPSLPKS